MELRVIACGLLLVSWLGVAIADTDGCGAEGCPAKVDFYLKAVAITAGPYGEFWEVQITPQREIHVAISYAIDPMGNLSGKFLVDPPGLQHLLNTFEAQNFFDLPKDIRTEGFAIHAPDLRLTVRLGEKSTEIHLYDPETITDEAKKQRFMKVWHAVFALLPLKPTW